MLITRKYLSDIQPPLSYKVFEASSLHRQVDLNTSSLRVLSEPQDLALLLELSSKAMSLEELSDTLGIAATELIPSFQRLMEGELVAIIDGKYSVTELGENLLTRMGQKEEAK